MQRPVRQVRNVPIGDVTPVYSITPSTVASNLEGSFRPNVLAVLSRRFSLSVPYWLPWTGHSRRFHDVGREFAIGTRVTSRPPHRSVRAQFGHTACMGLVWGFVCQGGINPFLSSFVIPFFCSTCAASILSSRPHICIAVAHSGGQGRRFFSAAEGLSLTDASTAAGC